MDAFQLLEQIGSGQSAKAFKVLHLEEGSHYAMKIIDQKTFSDERKKKIMGEIRLLKSLCHPNIVRSQTL